MWWISIVRSHACVHLGQGATFACIVRSLRLKLLLDTKGLGEEVVMQGPCSCVSRRIEYDAMEVAYTAGTPRQLVRVRAALQPCWQTFVVVGTEFVTRVGAASHRSEPGNFKLELFAFGLTSLPCPGLGTRDVRDVRRERERRGTTTHPRAALTSRICLRHAASRSVIGASMPHDSPCSAAVVADDAGRHGDRFSCVWD